MLLRFFTGQLTTVLAIFRSKSDSMFTTHFSGTFGGIENAFTKKYLQGLGYIELLLFNSKFHIKLRNRIWGGSKSERFAGEVLAGCDFGAVTIFGSPDMTRFNIFYPFRRCCEPKGMEGLGSKSSET